MPEHGELDSKERARGSTSHHGEPAILDFNVLVRLLAVRAALKAELADAKFKLDAARDARDLSANRIAVIEAALARVTNGIEIRYDTVISPMTTIEELLVLAEPTPPTP